MKKLMRVVLFLIILSATGCTDSNSTPSSRNSTVAPKPPTTVAPKPPSAVAPKPRSTVAQKPAGNFQIEHESRAAAIDIENAKLFFRQLPEACRSNADVSEDRTVTITYFCQGNGKTGYGKIKMKNGIVTGVE